MSGWKQQSYQEYCTGCTPAKLHCGGVIPTGPDGAKERCSMLDEHVMLARLERSYLTRSVRETPHVIELEVPLVVLTTLGAGDTLTVLQWAVTRYNRASKDARYYHCPAWSSRQYSFLEEDHVAPDYVAYAYPDLIAGAPSYMEQFIGKILGRLVEGKRTVIGTAGAWEPEGDMGQLLLYEMERGR